MPHILSGIFIVDLTGKGHHFEACVCVLCSGVQERRRSYLRRADVGTTRVTARGKPLMPPSPPVAPTHIRRTQTIVSPLLKVGSENTDQLNRLLSLWCQSHTTADAAVSYYSKGGGYSLLRCPKIFGNVSSYQIERVCVAHGWVMARKHLLPSGPTVMIGLEVSPGCRYPTLA